MPPDDHQRPPPHHLEAEEAVLGAMLLDTGALEHALATLDTTDFYRPTPRTIFDAIATLEAAGRPVDPITLAARLLAAGDLADVGGHPFIHTLVQAVPTVAQHAHYVELVAQTAAARRLIDAGHRITQLGHEQGLDPDKAHQIALELLGQLGTARPHAGVRDHRFQDGDVAILDAPADIETIWGDDQEVAWAAGEATVVVGPQGVGKSTLVQRAILARIGIGPAKLLGMPVAPTASKVLYLACDRPRQIIRSMRRMVSEDDRKLLAERLVVWKGPPPEDFAKNPKLLLELARQAGADTVIVDSLKDVALDIAKDEGGAGYNRARQIALAAGIEILEIHHQRKSQSDNRKPRKLDDVYGSNFLTAGAGSVLLLWGQPGDRLVEMFHLKQPAEEIGKMQLLHDAETGSISVQQQLDPLSLVNSQPGITAADAARLLYEIEGQIEAKETEKARSRLAALVKRGLIREERGSRGGRTPNPTTYHPIINREEP